MADFETHPRQHASISKETALQALNTIIQLHFEKTLEKKRAIDLQKKELQKLFQLFFIFLALVFLSQSLSPRLECRHCWIPIALLSVSHLSFYVSVAQTLRSINGFKYQRRCHKLTLGLATEKLREIKMRTAGGGGGGGGGFDGGVADEEFEIHYQEPPESYLGAWFNWHIACNLTIRERERKMGACATKPKVLKADSAEAPPPAPAPEPAPEDGGGPAAETKVENAGGGKPTEIVDDDKVDSKSRSLSNLFDDQNEVKDSNEKEKTAADPSEKQETSPETEKQMNPPPEEKPSETNPPEPPPSDSVTDKTTITSDAVETPSEEKTKTEPNNENESVEEKIKVEVTNENDPSTEKTESSEKPTETEKEVKVISN